MTVVKFPPRTFQSLVGQYVQSRTRRKSAISTTAAIRAIRAVMPGSPYSDREMATIIAREAVLHGYAVFFDGAGDKKRPKL